MIPCLLLSAAAMLVPVQDSAVREAADRRPFAIRVVDADSGRGVPLVELRTTNELLFVTDSAGYIAFNEPGLMDQDVYFQIRSHGYTMRPDGFGFRGARLHPVAGGKAEVKLQRVNIAERLCRLTGQGIYRDSVLLGLPVPTRRPVLNGGVMGQDSVMAVPFRGRIYWFWGDTSRASYPLGNFGTSGATSPLPDAEKDTSCGIDYEYFVGKDGFSRQMIPPESVAGPGPKWLSGLTVVKDDTGQEHLVGKYVRMKSLAEMVEQGIVGFDEEPGVFKRLAHFDVKNPLLIDGHPTHVLSRGEAYLYCGSGPPYLLRVRARLADVLEPAAYEGFSCLAADARFEKSATRLDRDRDGRLVFGWKRNTPPLSLSEQDSLVSSGLVKQEEVWSGFRDVETGKTIRPHAGSLTWNPHRRRWVALFVQQGGTSYLGEIWYAEAESPLGPWGYARKVVTHDRYSFYNPVHHAFLDRDGGRVLFFEGTYTAQFSGSKEKTPGYDYNQILYRLDLSDPRLSLPSPVYAGKNHEPVLTPHDRKNPARPIFHAVPADRARGSLVPIFASGDGVKFRLQSRPERPDLKPRFLAAPADADGVVALYEYRRPTTGERVYAPEPGPEGDGWQRAQEPLCHVWPCPPGPAWFDSDARPQR